MNPELLKRWESLTSAAAGDARAAARWGKLRRMLGVASASLLFAFVALTLVNAAAGLTVALLVLGVATGVATAWAYREVHAVSRLADARQQEMQAIIEAVEQHEKTPRTPLAIGFANLCGPEMDDLVRQDAERLGPLFMRARVPAHRQIPSAEVLFVYAHLNEDGTLQGPKAVGVRQIVQTTHAAIVVVASPNSPQSIRNAVGLRGPRSANLVFTIDRRGDSFGRFFRSLFEKMQAGDDMLGAWATLAPQQPGGGGSDAPATILAAEGGKIAFPRD
ncbi:hypothetical protein [Roseateles puraquae]|uniref:Uncharacterized protein n=1 Tax=Roseateles puraquae TaxID=431059 RepID=A0A254NBG1_9BURK|nr:hypothetical protein [Roseateles puraquae]MDG0852579.1 hypothetical protein [Roseateles puraquae]OWR05296.1 hypothetical protein CDO81_02190 [Roseateles puraquae]